MAVYVSLLRGINVSGRNPIAMADLRALYEWCGHRDVTTYVQSGNVVSTAAAKRPDRVAATIERAISDTWGLAVDVLVRTPSELATVLASNPFTSTQSDPTKLHVTFLQQAATAPAEGPLVDDARFSPDEFVMVGREVYVHCPGGYGKTKINNAFFEKQLGVRATTRNWKTVSKLVELTQQ